MVNSNSLIVRLKCFFGFHKMVDLISPYSKPVILEAECKYCKKFKCRLAQ